MARILGPRPVELTLAARSAEQVEAMRETNTNERYFPSIEFPHDTHFTTVDDAAGQQWDGIVLAVPTSAFAATVERFADKAPVFLSLGKGLDPSGRRLSQVAAEFISPDRYVTLSGPNIAKEMMADLPTAAVVAGTNRDTVLAIQDVVNTRNFRVYAATDIIGVELAGASKNVIAIAAGVLEGSGLGDNAIAAMMTRGLGEMARLGLASGASLQTYLGLAGVGDLMVTCRSPHSRNHRAGRLLAEGVAVPDVKAQIGQVVEGMRTAPIVRDMAHAAGIEMHICEAVAQVVEHEVPLADVVRTMMSRPPGFEFAGEHEFG
ncbi:MAG: NAD-dependent glycerol-3-phosphate dehydrogenase-like [Thermoleophilia bacterium]|nr:NAD-dependent glycerol-3-phosphate dehydrogenase-like [Thermoleophilia bacterium]